MATVTLRTATADTVRPLERFVVRAKEAWSDTWRTIPYLIPISATWQAAPQMSTARLRWDYGSIKREDKPSFTTYRPKDLKKWFIQILRISADGKTPVWHGLIPDESFEIDGDDDVATGTQEMRAVGLEYVLDRYTIEGATVIEDSVQQTIERTPIFNLRHQYGKAVVGNRSTDVGADGVYLFSCDGAEWTNRDICQYLLEYHTTPGINFRLSGQDEMLDNLTEIHRLEGLTTRQALNHLVDRHRGLGWCVRTDGAATVYIHVFSVLGSALSVGDQTIPANNERFDLALDDDITVSEAMVRIEEASQYDRIRVIGGPLKSCFSVSYTDGTLEAGWTETEEAAYVAGDTSDDEDPDKNDAERKTDKFQRVYQMFRLPQYFDWLVNNGEDGLESDQVANPTLLRDGTLDTETQAPTWNFGKAIERHTPFQQTGEKAGAEPEYTPPMVFAYDKDGLRWVLIEAADAAGVENGSCMVRPVDRESALEVRGRINHVLGFRHFGSVVTNYTNPEFTEGEGGVLSGWTITGGTWDGVGAVDFDLSEEESDGTLQPNPIPAFNLGNTYQIYLGITVDEASDENSGVSISLDGADSEKVYGSGEAEIELSPVDGLGGNLVIYVDAGFVGSIDYCCCIEAPPATNIDPVFNWQHMIATVMIATDERLRIDAYTSGYSETSNPKVLTLDIDDAELWYIVPGTVRGVTEGALVRVDEETVVRDDRPRLRLIAAMAAAWYGRYRAAVAVTWRHVARYADVGQYLSEVSNSWQREEVGTPVTAMSWDFDAATTTLTTGYWALDVTRLIDLFPGMSDPRAVGREIRAMRRDIREIQARIGNLPTRWTVSAGGGSGSTTVQTLPVVYTGVY